MNQPTQHAPAGKGDPITAALAGVIGPIVRKAVADALAEHDAGAAPKPELLTTDQICAALQISRSKLSQLRAEGLPTVVLGDSLRFSLPQVLAWVAQRSAEHMRGADQAVDDAQVALTAARDRGAPESELEQLAKALRDARRDAFRARGAANGLGA